jgi:hypothetical protein
MVQSKNHLRNVEIHWLIMLLTSVLVFEAGASAFDLNSTSGLSLDMLNISTSSSDNLSTEIETRNWFQVDWNLFFWPFALIRISNVMV